jgi:pilus assembly protein FimV
MKRPLQLSLAIALALGATNAFALGLGPIQVQSGLNQPLKAEILIIQSSPGEAEGLIVQLATDEDFERVGMNRSGIGVPLEFTRGKNARGEPVIRISSTEIVREPFVGLLLEANWPKGRLLREYTVLLDPPIMAPAVKGSSAVAVAAKEPEPTATQPLPPSKPAAKAPPATPAVAAKPAAAAPKPSAPAPAPAAPQVSGDQYGPVAAGETLGEIARATLPNDSVNLNQMMLALLKSNPEAFFKNNINALKRGAVLRIPNAEEIAANGTAREAAAAVRAQIDEWRGIAGSSPTLVADTAPTSTSRTTESSPGATSRTSGERLALVPPREGSEGQQSADRPSGGRAGGTGDAATKAELARVKEALTSKEQESTELKSRVKDLEDIRGKNEKLINLQSTELAELRDKLKALQEQASAETAAAAAKAPVAAAPTVVAPAPEAAKAVPPPATAKTDAASAGKTITKEDIWGDADSVVATPPAPGDSATDAAEPAAAAVAPADDSKVTSPATTEPVAAPATAPDKAPPATPKKAEPKPAAGKPATTPAKPRPAPEEPWYLQPWALAAAGIGGLLLVILGIFGLRKRKPAARPTRTSIASSFGDSPVGPAVAASASDDDAEEQELIAQVQADPSNAGAHLELLSLYYAQGASEKFEAAAEEMYAYIADPNQPAWREVRTMGEELVPHNPLFSQQGSLASDYSTDDDVEEYRFDETAPDEPIDFPAFDDEPLPVEPVRTESSLATASMPALDVSDFDLGETRMPPPEASADTSFSFDLPPIEEVPSMKNPPAAPAAETHAAATSPADASDDEFFAGEDAIGTKLDLAKAYLDMGDPEGARAMLEEVLAEGAPSQQEEARRLIGEIG